jgi:Carboxypeptidase regulatory-like domain/TonB dependent receptor
MLHRVRQQEVRNGVRSMSHAARSTGPAHVQLVLAALLYLASYPCQLQAQTDAATLSGRVTAVDGGVLPGTEVAATNTASGLKTNSQTNEDGIYVLSDLHPGNYQVTVQKQGFRQVILTGLILEVQDALSRNFTMQLGPVNETVRVVAGEEEISLSPAVSTVVNQEFVQNMPLNGRTFQSLLALTPGYTLTVSSYAVGGSASGQFSVNGQRANANYFMVDGASANFASSPTYGLGQTAGGTLPGFNIQGETNGLVSMDDMQEFRVQSSTFAPEFGRMPGAQISIVTRQGTNDWHGTLFDYLRNDVFDAKNYFDMPPLPKPALRQNNFGGTVGGPIHKDQAFFFFSYEGLRLLEPAVEIGTFYTAAARANVAPAYQPLLASLPIPTGPVNADGLTAPLTIAYSDPTSFDNSSLRIDYKLNDHVTLFGRYDHAPSIESSHSFSELGNVNSNVDTFTAGATIAFGVNKVNDLRANWSRFLGQQWTDMIPFLGGVPPPASAMFAPGHSSATDQFVLELPDIAEEVRSGKLVNNEEQQLEFADDFSISERTHQLKFGADLRQLTPVSAPPDYSALVTANDYSALQAGIASSVFASGGVPIRTRIYNYSLFAQDVWKATSRLTMTYGLRWEINTPLHSITAGKPLYSVNGIFNSQPFGLAPPSVPLWHTHFTDFAPRVGGAYQVAPQTIVRGGFGLFYDIGFGGGIADTMVYFPYTRHDYTISPVPFDFNNPAFALPPFTLVPQPGITAYMSAVNPDLRLPLVYEWNFAVEQALGANQSASVTYLGSYGTRLIREDVIQNNPSGAPSIFANRNADWSNYNALQIQFQRRMSKGLQVLASYTLGHSEDTNSIDVCQCTYTNNIQNVNVARDYGPSEFDVRNSFATAISYEFPTPKLDSAVAGALLHGWTFYGVLRINSAQPFGLLAFGSSPVFGQYYTRPDIVPGQPFYLPDPGQPGGRILNRAAFARPASGEQGDLPRNYFRGFPTDEADLAISRRFSLSNRITLDMRVEYFNALNHPMFAPPSANLGNYLSSPYFGEITDTQNDFYGSLDPLYQVGGPRSGQLTLRLQF